MLYLWNCILSCTHARMEFSFPDCLSKGTHTSHLPELSSNILPNTAKDNFSHHHNKLRTASELPDCQPFSFSTTESNTRLSPSLKAPMFSSQWAVRTDLG